MSRPRRAKTDARKNTNSQSGASTSDGGSGESSELAAVERQKLAFEKEKHEFEKEKLTRERWWHEDRLINERMTWLFTMQALIWGGYAFLRYRITEVAFHMSERAPLEEKRYLDSLYGLAGWIRWLGIASAAAIGVGLVAAVWAQRMLKRDHQGIEFGARWYTTWLGYLAALVAASICVAGWWLTASYLPTIDVAAPDHIQKYHQPPATWPLV